MRLETILLHAGASVDPASGAVAPPIHLSTTYARDEASELIGPVGYIREGSPTQAQLESALAPAEGGARALAFSSGMAAASALLQALSPGDHVVLPDDAYYGLSVAASDFFSNWGIRTDRVAMEDLGALERAIRPETRLVWLESPSNPLLKVTDLPGAIAVARRRGVETVVVDNTFATPVLQQPLRLGADVVMHSMTKYIGGHSDLLGGVLVFARDGALRERVEHGRHILGGVASPFNCWLALRGLRTLAVRIERHSANALAVARALAAEPRVSAVHYPGLETHPGHDVARRQMSAFGGMLSFRVRGGRDAALAAVGRVRLFTRATSLGAVESLIEHRATSEGPTSRTPPELIRLSVGLEHPDDLVEDLRQALAG